MFCFVGSSYPGTEPFMSRPTVPYLHGTLSLRGRDGYAAIYHAQTENTPSMPHSQYLYRPLSPDGAKSVSWCCYQIHLPTKSKLRFSMPIYWSHHQFLRTKPCPMFGATRTKSTNSGEARLWDNRSSSKGKNN